MRSCTSQVSVLISSRNHLSWVTTMRAPEFGDQRFLRCPASQVIALDVEVVVGSSSAMTSQSPVRSFASETRRR